MVYRIMKGNYFPLVLNGAMFLLCVCLMKLDVSVVYGHQPYAHYMFDQIIF